MTAKAPAPGDAFIGRQIGQGRSSRSGSSNYGERRRLHRRSRPRRWETYAPLRNGFNRVGSCSRASTDTAADYLNIEIINAPADTYDIGVILVVELDSLEVSMPMVIHIVPPGVVYADPLIGTRQTVYR